MSGGLISRRIMGGLLAGSGKGAQDGIQENQRAANQMKVDDNRAANDLKREEMKARILAERQENLKRLSKGSPWGSPVRTTENGKTYLAGMTYNDKTGETALSRVEVPGDLVSTLGETAGEQTDRKVKEASGTTFASGEAKNAAKYMGLADEWEVNREFLIQSIPDMKAAFESGPGSSVSKGVQSALGKIVGNSSGADAQAKIEQFGAMFLQGMPFPPGSQSDKEMQARAQVLSEQLVNPSVTPDTKINLIGKFVEWQDTKAKNYRKRANKILGVSDDSDKAGGIDAADTSPVVGAKRSPIDNKWYVQKNGQWYLVE